MYILMNSQNYFPADLKPIDSPPLEVSNAAKIVKIDPETPKLEAF